MFLKDYKCVNKIIDNKSHQKSFLKNQISRKRKNQKSVQKIKVLKAINQTQWFMATTKKILVVSYTIEVKEIKK